MPLHIKDPATEAAVRRLAKLRGVTLTEAVRQACEEEIAKAETPGDHDPQATPSEYAKRMQAFLEDFRRRHPMSPEPLPKAFYDELWGEE